VSTPQLVLRIRETVELKRRGNRYSGHCPFHNEKSPSFHVFDNGRKWRWHCFGCGATGDEIDWLMRTRRLTYKQAAASLSLPIQPRRSNQDIERERQQKAQRMFDEVLWSRRVDKCYGITAEVAPDVDRLELFSWLPAWRGWLAARPRNG
jgi:hypothetical protein